MTRTTLIAFAAGAATTGTLTALVATGPGHDDHHHDAQDMWGGMEPDEMMQAYMALGTPGEHHEEMMDGVGSWNAVTRFVMDPEHPDQMEESAGTAVTVPVLGGRFFKTEFKSDMMGMPFTGHAYSGYDNGREQFVSVWMDTMSTAITHMTGHMNADGDLVMVGEAFAPGVGEYTMKMVYHWEDADHWTQTFYDQMPDGSWFRSGEIAYTRE